MRKIARQRTVNCDQVFERLTRGPFPGGDGIDDAVQLHLVGCHECRTLAEAMRPATALLHETTGGDPVAQDLPVWTGGSAEPAESLPELVDRMVDRASDDDKQGDVWPQPGSPRAPQHSHRSTWVSARGVVAICVTIATTCFTVIQLTEMLSRRRQGPDAWPQQVVAIEQLPVRLASLNLPPSCRNVRGEQTLRHESSAAGEDHERQDEFHCCTHCHTAESVVSPPVKAVAVVIRSCSTCHGG